MVRRLRRIFQKSKFSHRGMFLLEAILAIVILTVTISVIIESLVSSLRATVFTIDYSQAILLADHRMSGLLTQRYVAPALQDENKFPQLNDQFRYELKTIGAAPEDGPTGLTEAELKVFWASGSKEHSVTVVSWFQETAKNKNSPGN